MQVVHIRCMPSRLSKLIREYTRFQIRPVPGRNELASSGNSARGAVPAELWIYLNSAAIEFFGGTGVTKVR
jgi:hypothetical protein